MSLSPLISIAGAALGTLAISAASKLTGGLSFAEILHLNKSEKTADDKSTADEAAAGLDEFLSAGGSVGIQQIELAAQKALQQFQKQLNELLAAQGIDLSQPINLQSDQFGGIDLTNDHPQRAQIEQLLADHPELGEQFNELSAAFGFLRARQERQAFSQLYAIDPTLAAERENRRNENAPGEFLLSLLGEEAQVRFESFTSL